MKYLLTLILAGCGGISTPPTTTCALESHDWNGYHLPHHALSPVVVNHTSYEPDLKSWNNLGSPIELRDHGRGFELAIEEGGNRASGWLGLATVTVGAEGHIQSATVTMNTTLLSPYPPRVAQHVLCQEIGHLLGLGHTKALDSCMEDCQGRADWLGCISSLQGTTPNPHDGEQLTATYQHATDGTKPPKGCGSEVVIHAFEAP